jgi:enamine deaminase RidA (YjgF/YER057c/UK114 family)
MPSADAAPKPVKPIGAYSPLRIVPIGTTKLVFISGLTSGGEAPYDMAGQAEVIFARMNMLLAEAGGNIGHLVKITTFLTDMRHYAAYNAVRNRVFAEVGVPPTSATVGTPQLVSPDAMIEIEGVAVIPGAS